MTNVISMNAPIADANTSIADTEKTFSDRSRFANYCPQDVKLSRHMADIRIAIGDEKQIPSPLTTDIDSHSVVDDKMFDDFFCGGIE